MNRKPFPSETLEQYPRALLIAREIGKRHGYAIGLHGSQTYDLDLIACPWTDDAGSAYLLAYAIACELEWYLHVRICTRQATWAHLFLNLRSPSRPH